MINPALFSSDSGEWETPDDLFKEWDDKFHFTLDATASNVNYKCENYYTKEDNSLTKSWEGTVWLNPPYGRGIGVWVQKAYEESLKGATIVCLLPSRTDTKWFHNYCKLGEITFIKGRIKFKGGKHCAPFPSLIVIFRGERR